jgi:hypothetical protein
LGLFRSLAYRYLDATSKFAVFSPGLTSNLSVVSELNRGETASIISSIISPVGDIGFGTFLPDFLDERISTQFMPNVGPLVEGI